MKHAGTINPPKAPFSSRVMSIVLMVGINFLALSALAADGDCSKWTPIQKFGVENFLATIESGAHTSIKSSLCLMPEQIRKNAVLINNSISLQGGTLEFPRAIMFDPGASDAPVKYAISYNGHPS